MTKEERCICIIGFIAAAALLVMPETYELLCRLIGG